NLAAQVDPRNPEVQALLAEARKRHEATRAEREMDVAAKAEDNHDYAAAAEAYRAASAIDPSNARAAFKAAQCMQRLGQEPKDIRLFAQRAVELEPRNADHQALLGAVLTELGMKKLGQKHLQEALQLDNDHPEAKKILKKGRWPF
ncbi:MAG TPA: molecular chaperone DnaJ, partial [Myxococcaceae bacterium]|nr:molecular chaperone DnaJ [Myxococcaceae bacterium]